MSVKKELFGRLKDGREVFAFTLENKSGMSVKIINYGGAVVSLFVPDRDGKYADVVGGYDTLDSYVGGDGYQGALIGRVGNRICDGRFTLDDVEYKLAANNGKNHLHGGNFGFNSKVWDAALEYADEPVLSLSYNLS